MNLEEVRKTFQVRLVDLEKEIDDKNNRLGELSKTGTEQIEKIKSEYRAYEKKIEEEKAPLMKEWIAINTFLKNTNPTPKGEEKKTLEQ